uniref:Ubiquitin-like domain-containing protein n=1 Tax=Alexandrium monilatum TaxID=311494 RepID=A0A7S4PV05_9DINO
MEAEEHVTVVAHGALSGERLAEVSVRASSTVAGLTLAVQEATGLKQLQLLAGSRPLAGSETLAAAGLGQGASVGVVARRTPPVATGSADATARLWDSASGECSQVLRGHHRGLNSVAFSPDADRLASASADYTAKIWCVATGACLATLSGHAHYVNSAAFSHDGRQLATGAAEACTHPSQMRHQKGAAWVWDVEHCSCTLRLEGHDGYVNSAVFCRDGRMVLTASNDTTARLWDLAAGHCVQTFSGHIDYVISAAFSPDDRSLVTASDDKTARTWDLASDRGCNQTFVGHGGEVRGVAFSPDGASLATASKDRTAKLWSVAGGECWRTLIGHRGPVHSVSFAPEGKEVLTSSLDRTARIWDTEKAVSLHLHAHEACPASRAAACLLSLQGHTSHVFSACFPYW